MVMFHSYLSLPADTVDPISLKHGHRGIFSLDVFPGGLMDSHIPAQPVHAHVFLETICSEIKHLAVPHERKHITNTREPSDGNRQGLPFCSIIGSIPPHAYSSLKGYDSYKLRAPKQIYFHHLKWLR